MRTTWYLICFLAIFPEMVFFSTGRATPADTLFILFSANTSGQLLDCGCESGIAGGIPRRKTLLDSLRRQLPHLIAIDGGDLMATNDRQLQNWMMLKYYQSLKYDAVSIGDQEFWNGIFFLKRKGEMAHLPFVLSNSSKLFKDCAAFRLVRKRDLSVLIVSVLDSSAFGFFPPEKMPNLHLEKPLTSLRREFARPVDVRIVVFHGEQYALADLVKKMPFVDLWLLAHQQHKMDTVWNELPDPAIVTCDEDGESVMLIRLVRKRIQDKWQAAARRIHLSEKIHPDPEQETEIEKYYLELRTQLAGENSKPYRRTSACRHCHLLAYEDWQKSPHGANRDRAVQCSVCHLPDMRHGEWGFEDRKALERARDCSRCHDRGEIRFENSWKMIQHGLE